MSRTFDRLSPTTPLRERAAEAIRNAILESRILPGDKIGEQDLAAELGISRVPVREAIRILEQQGLLEIQPKSGTFVRKLSYEELLDGIRIRIALEKLGLEESFERLQGNGWESLCDELDSLVAQMREATARGDQLLRTKIDLQLHTTMIDAAHNSQLSEIWRGLGLPLRFMAQTRTYGQPTAGEHALSIASHEKLVAAFRRRDLQGCLSEIEEHAHWQLRLRVQEQPVTKEEAQVSQEPAR